MTLPDSCVLLFWFSLGLLIYTFLGYPLVMHSLARLTPERRRPVPPTQWPTVSVVLVVGNEEQRITPRLQNLLASDYPADRLEILVVTDGSTDATAARVRELGEARVKLVPRPERAGKSAGLNAGIPLAGGEIVVLCDARQSFAPGTIRALAGNFSDPAVGAVSGELFIDPAASGVGAGVDLYWRLEKMIRTAEARRDSCIGCTGAVYALRRALFTPIAPDTILDDVVIPMQIAVAGHRVLYDTAAPAYDPQALEPARERGRKQRTLAGNFQMLFRHPVWLLPWRNRLWWQLLSHKYLRIAAPLTLAVIFSSNLALVHAPIYRALCAGQCLFYGLAAAGLAVPSLRVRVVSLPAGFVFLNLMTVGGCWNWLRGAYTGGRW